MNLLRLVCLVDLMCLVACDTSTSPQAAPHVVTPAAPSVPPAVGVKPAFIRSEPDALTPLLNGGAALTQLPVHATDPGVAFDPTLRNKLAPTQRSSAHHGSSDRPFDRPGERSSSAALDPWD